MKIVKDTLEPLVDTWSDPGDYPNAVASGPLPDYDYLAGVEGEVVVELTTEEFARYQECPEDFLREELDVRMPDGILSWELQVDKVEGTTLTISVLEVEADPDWRPDDGPDHPDI